jgi:hypothetical protein
MVICNTSSSCLDSYYLFIYFFATVVSIMFTSSPALSTCFYLKQVTLLIFIGFNEATDYYNLCACVWC